MTDAAEQPTNNINFVTRGMYYLHDLVDTVVQFLEKVLVHSQTEIVMEKSCMWPPIPLVVIDPNHGTAIYTWEKKQPHDNSWKKIDVPSHTCLLYVDTTMQYRCSVDDKVVVFNVKGTNIVIVTLIPHSLLP